MTETFAQLRKRSEDELIARHDSIAGRTEPGVSYYLAELARRDQDRATNTMVRLTWAIFLLTLISTAAVLRTLLR